MPFRIVRNDITNMKVDAIVNTASPEPGCGRGTDSAIYEKAGARRLLAQRKKIGRIEEGEAEITSAFSLNAKYIIHTVGPVWQGGGRGEAAKVRSCYEKSLGLALRHGCKSIAFPLISTGAYGYPKQEALEIAVSVVGEFLAEAEMTVYLVVFDGESFALSGSLFTGVDAYIDEHYVEEKLEEEYGFAGPQPAAGPNLLRRAARQDALPPASAAYSAVSDREAQRSRPPALAQNRGKERNADRSLEDVVAQLGETFQQRLLRFIDERGMTDVEVYKRANLDRKLFSKIRCNTHYRPKKMTAIALAVALRLNLDETKDLLSRAELALSPSSKFDLIIEYFIDREVYDIYTINLALFQHEEPLLGEP